MQRTLNIKACFLTAVLSVFAAGTACTEEEMMHEAPGKDRMSFAVSISDRWNIAETRTADDSGSAGAVKLEGSDLWLITTIEDNCDTTLFDVAGTRAVPTTTENFSDRIENFGVYAYTYTGDWNAGTDKELYISGDAVRRNGNVWDFDPPRFWPGESYQMKFFAYAPYSLENMLVSENDGLPSISYTVDTDSRNQKDLLATTTMADAAGDYNMTLGLKFQHILTAINVKGSDPFNRTISSVTFTGVVNSGSYTYGDSQWVPAGNETTISCTNLDKTLGNTLSEVISDADGTTFMMIPQVLGQNAGIKVTFSDGQTLSASLAGKEWPVGKRITYIISDSGIQSVIEVPELIEFEYYGGTEDFVVESYITNTTTSQVLPAAWTAEFSENGGEYTSIPPAWLRDFETSGDGSTMDNNSIKHEVRISTVPAQSSNVSNIHNMALREKSPLGTDTNPYDLSTKGGQDPMNTANCYIVNEPGTYSFPLVYGNAVKNGADYKTAYTSTVGLRNFLNHANVSIKSPYIGEDKYANGSLIETDAADLVWQDVLNLVTNVRLVKGANVREDRIVFDVPKDRIQQGNAIIAVYDDKDMNKVLWSWHIWVTDFVPLSDLQTDAELKAEGEAAQANRTYDIDAKQYDKKVWSYNNAYSYIFMGLPIGFCHAETTTYESREVKIRFTQTDTGMRDSVIIRQIPKTITTTMNAPYYQWGRKDPMLPVCGESEVSKTHYDKEGIETTVWGTDVSGTGSVWPLNSNTIGNGIAYPHLFCTNSWMDNQKYYNLWDIDNNTVGQDVYIYDIKPGKTVYDPSPVGYVIPQNGAYSGTTYNTALLDGTGKTSGHDSGEWYLVGFNSPYVNDGDYDANKGFIFYCRGMNGSRGNYNPAYGVIFYPLLGYRSAQSYCRLYAGLYTSGTPYKRNETSSYTEHMHRLFFTNHCVWPHLPNPKGEGLSARPIREQ